ncbi:AAA family ATPase [Microbacteriaceae bacterium VKM Ac-2855]|nr:AAA family ATPase [Microbacteriaceae bacterium VKM Ac-2855]
MTRAADAAAAEARPARIAIAGPPGVGKTALALQVAERLPAPAIELDELFHGPNWSVRESFDAEVESFTRTERWVTEWQFDTAKPVIAARADTMLWLDLPLRVAMSRLVRRSIRRRGGREALWAGNTEPPLWTALVDRNHLIPWSLRVRRELRVEVPAAARANPALRVVRLRSQAQVDAWLATL